MRFFGLILTLALAGSTAAVASAHDGSGGWVRSRGGQVDLANQRSGALHVTKDCTDNKGLADQHCTITSSNIKALTAGSRVVYLQAAGTSSLDSDIVIVVGPGNFAIGHVTLDFATKTGELTISGGIGKFSSFHAKADVSYLDGNNWAWDGKYSVRKQDD